VTDTRILVKKAQRNDLAAFEELVHIYQNKVFALCVNLAGNRDDAQDLAQEAFIRAYKALASFRSEANFGTWLHRIAVNVWLNHKRKKSSHQLLSLDEHYQSEDGDSLKREVAAGDGDPLQLLEEKEFSSMVYSALRTLSEEHRAVLVLREIEGYSYEEVAQMLGCSLGTVKSRLSRAREAMRRSLKNMASDTVVKTTASAGRR
jgi:RNA polymerase sigma-70 factor (ECF subfamily)